MPREALVYGRPRTALRSPDANELKVSPIFSVRLGSDLFLRVVTTLIAHLKPRVVADYELLEQSVPADVEVSWLARAGPPVAPPLNR